MVARSPWPNAEFFEELGFDFSGLSPHLCTSTAHSKCGHNLKAIFCSECPLYPKTDSGWADLRRVLVVDNPVGVWTRATRWGVSIFSLPFPLKWGCLFTAVQMSVQPLSWRGFCDQEMEEPTAPRTDHIHIYTKEQEQLRFLLAALLGHLGSSCRWIQTMRYSLLPPMMLYQKICSSY